MVGLGPQRALDMVAQDIQIELIDTNSNNVTENYLQSSKSKDDVSRFRYANVFSANKFLKFHKKIHISVR